MTQVHDLFVGHVSGAHLKPTVTLSLAIVGIDSTPYAAPYIVASTVQSPAVPFPASSRHEASGCIVGEGRLVFTKKKPPFQSCFMNVAVAKVSMKNHF